MMTPRPDMIRALAAELAAGRTTSVALTEAALAHAQACLLYTSDAADEGMAV